jgi:putative endonuclease
VSWTSKYERKYYIYILASDSRVLYIGMTNNIHKRLRQHRGPETEHFAQKYAVRHLVRLEVYRDVHDAISREKELKGWRREKKIALIESENPAWEDFSPADEDNSQ